MASNESIERVRKMIVDRNAFLPESFFTLSEEAKEDLVPHFAELLDMEPSGVFSPREHELCMVSAKCASRLTGWLLASEISEKVAKAAIDAAIDAYQEKTEQIIEEYVARVKKIGEKYTVVAFAVGILLGWFLFGIWR